MVAPTDLNTLYLVGGPLAPPGQEALLGCSLQNPPYTAGMPQCNESVVNQFSPISYTKAAISKGVTLPPVYFAYGGLDTLVLISTQGCLRSTRGRRHQVQVRPGTTYLLRERTTSMTTSTIWRSITGSTMLRMQHGPGRTQRPQRTKPVPSSVYGVETHWRVA